MYLRCLFVLCALLLCHATLDAAAGELVLKNAAHADTAVGPSSHDGISQGHDLKFVIQKVKHGKKMAKQARIRISIRQGAQEYQQLNATLNDTGYAETIFTIPDHWIGVYQVNVSGYADDKEFWSSSKPFRVIPAEPGSDVPEATPLALLLAAIIALCVCWRPLVQRD